MNIAISGATGFIGTYLSAYLTEKGYNIIPLKRVDFQNDSGLAKIISECEVIINMAGAPINHRWTTAWKKELYESRILTTRKIVNAINASGTPHTLISASAIGYYSSRECYDEHSAQRGSSFLADLSFEWEHEAHRVSGNTRLIITRFGIVLSPEGGAFPQITAPVKAGITAILGSSSTPFSWISLHDLARAMEFLIKDESLKGIFNFTAPEKLTQKTLAYWLAKHYKTRLTIRIPKFAFQLLYGEASEFLTQGQCVYPRRLIENGFQFTAPDIQKFLSGIR